MQSQIRIKCIHHVSLITQQVERTARFYVDLLGLHPTDRPLGDNRPALHVITLSDTRGTLVTITETADGLAGQIGIGITHHVALAVATLDALLKWKRWLQDNQILVYGPYDNQAYQDIIFTDPDGVLLELATQGPGWEAMQDGRDVYSPPKESMAPYRDEESISSQTWPHPVAQIEPDMQLQGLHHISTIVSSLEQTDHFYRDILGLSLVRKTLDHDDPEVEHWYWGLDGGRPGTIITAFPIVHTHGDEKPVHGHTGVGVVDRFALDVDMDEEALVNWSAALSGQKVTSLPVRQAPSVSVQSPDGQAIDLVPAGPDRVF
jgi:glyoxalase family protein